jgi:hypothetical protein
LLAFPHPGVVGNGHRPVDARPRHCGHRRLRLLPPASSRERPWAEARAGPAHSFPRAREPGRERPRAGLFPRAGPVSIIKIVFCFLLLFMMKNIVEKCFCIHLSSKNCEINFYGLIGTRSTI